LPVFREFRRAWRQAVDNFWRELEADLPGEEQARGAYREVARVRTQLEQLDQEIADTRARRDEELKQVDVCARRERMAREIGDEETARVAKEYGGRHQERADVFQRKLDALEGERRLCRRDLEEMERALQDGRIQEARQELEDLNRHPNEHEFRDLEDADRGRSADERLAELKRRMGKQG
jgi:hypothetical protein